MEHLDKSSSSVPRIIAFEGVDGAGKSTVIARVAEHLRAQGHKIFMPRTGKEHSSRPTRMIRRLTRDQRNIDLTARAELALYCAREAQVLEELVRPAVARGETVLLDRSLLTPVVLGAFGRGLSRQDCEDAARVASGGLDPDLTLVFDVHPKTSRIRKRLDKVRRHAFRDGGRKGLGGTGMKERVREGYSEIAAERGYPLFYVERATPDQLSDRVIRVIEGGAIEQGEIDRSPLWMRDNLDFADALQNLPPLVALYLSRGLIAGRGLREAMLEQEPEVVAWALDREDPLRKRAAELQPQYSLSGLQRRPIITDDIRLDFVEKDPDAVLRALRHTEGPQADALRSQLVPSHPGSVVDSLSGREDDWAQDLRARHWDRADPHQRANSLAACSGEKCARLREDLFDKHPVRGLSTLRGVRAERADPWLRRYAECAPKSVVQALGGRSDDFAYALRDALYATGREVVDTIRGLDDPKAWELRARSIERWPSTVAWSLAGLPNSDRREAMLTQCKEVAGGDAHLARRLVGLKEQAQWPEWARRSENAADLGE